ncbi:Xaa-Pro peptidase family protein [Thalassospiraceae bacterium LMO-JJ14]|nr:Xaa-Pro peptidase family protein [Thalassospiraceae bacterium LMO-JJ14]
MPLHFDDGEYNARAARARDALAAHDLDGLLMFAPESHYWLTGYDTFGFALFQCMVMCADGDIHLLTRAPDLRQARYTSTLDDDHIHIWVDREGMAPADDLKALLDALGLHGKRLGIEKSTVGLTAANWDMVRGVLGEDFIDASTLIRDLRRVKSTAEIACHRRAAELADAALEAGIEQTLAGAFEGDILAAMQGAVFKGGGDYAGNEFILGSGPGALLCRYYSGRRHLDATDQLTIEWAGAYARYHAAMMRTLVVGGPVDLQKRMHTACVEALESCEAAMIPGDPMGNVFDAHARTFDAHGFEHARLNACGYGMGAVYNPIWVDFPMFFTGNPLPMDVGQVFFMHMILMDSESGYAMCWGHSVLIGENGVERLSKAPQDMIVC